MEGPRGILDLKEVQDKEIRCQQPFLALEVLLIQIREDNDIKGIIINNTNIKLSAYAGDTYFLASDVISFQYIFSKHAKYSSSFHP